MWFRCKCEISTLLNLICNDDDNDDDGLVVVVMGNRGRTTNWCISEWRADVQRLKEKVPSEETNKCILHRLSCYAA